MVLEGYWNEAVDLWGSGAHWEQKSSDERPRRRTPFEKALRVQIISKITNYENIELQAWTHYTRLVWLIFQLTNLSKQIILRFFSLLWTSSHLVFPVQNPLEMGSQKRHISHFDIAARTVFFCVLFSFFCAHYVSVIFYFSIFRKLCRVITGTGKKAKRGENPVAPYSMGNQQ